MWAGTQQLSGPGHFGPRGYRPSYRPTVAVEAWGIVRAFFGVHVGEPATWGRVMCTYAMLAETTSFAPRLAQGSDV
jgi:hypothetical protein